ncbi:hypothetical protein Patl1_23886 [Pistacia atlantica]|uniref:Uncharacterized protein n=1 Tax=Pistacia atlantica TaxID=434234 RepID=A0ACC0ZX81_9ROSI|nr:hypothetical protein Patl1_23886 [Pistacia atlantica]
MKHKLYDNAGPRVTVPRSLRWAACGAVSVSSTTALLVCLFSPKCEPRNIAAYDGKVVLRCMCGVKFVSLKRDLITIRPPRLNRYVQLLTSKRSIIMNY